MIRKITAVLRYIRYCHPTAVWNTVYLNFKCFPIAKALHFPVLCGRNINIKSVYKGCIECPTQFHVIKLGTDEGSFNMRRGVTSHFSIDKGGKLIVSGACRFSSNFHIHISPKGMVKIGRGFSSNFDFLMSCSNKITIGDGCMVGWNVTIIDGDGHKVLQEGRQVNQSKPVIIGCHCWIAANVTITKGVILAENTIVPMGCNIRKSSAAPSCIFVGDRVVKGNVCWEM